MGKNISKNMSKSNISKFLVMLNNLIQMYLKLLQKEQFKKKKKQVVILLTIKSLKKLQMSREISNKIVQKYLQMKH